MHVTAYRGPQAAQESDKVDRENASEQMDKAPAEIHALVRRVAYETQPPRNADDADGGNGVHGELDIDGTGGRRRAVAQGLFRALVENRHGQRIHERGEIQQQNGTDEAPDRRGAVEALFPADGLNKGDNGKDNADEIGKPDDDGPPLLQMRNDVGNVIFHGVTCP